MVIDWGLHKTCEDLIASCVEAFYITEENIMKSTESEDPSTAIQRMVML